MNTSENQGEKRETCSLVKEMLQEVSVTPPENEVLKRLTRANTTTTTPITLGLIHSFAVNENQDGEGSTYASQLSTFMFAFRSFTM
jgi:hypothetical protein